MTNTCTYDGFARQTGVTDGRGNTSLAVYNTLGQVEHTEDAASNRTAYTYDGLGRQASVSPPLSNTVFTAYDSLGNVTAQWGGTYPVAYEYDTAGRKAAMHTYRGSEEIASQSQIENLKPEMDRTRWLYDNVTGLLTNKVYADGSRVSYTYTPDGKLATRVWARGVTTVYSYDALGQLAGIGYSDATPDITFAYGVTSHIAGMCNSYDPFGRISQVAVDGVPSPFRYEYRPGTDLQQSLFMPNGVTRQTIYEPSRDLPASITHTNSSGNILTRRTFTRDASGNLTGRTQYRSGETTNRVDAFSQNARGELVYATLGTNGYAYAFDPIGNRLSADEPRFSAAYSANALNQYASISNSVPSCEFIPEFDEDGNQTLIRTSTGIWRVTYNAENRPVVFSNDTAVVEMGYDYMGRRFEYKETVSGTLARHGRYLYRGYLQIAALDLLDGTNLQHTLAWDPSEPVVTRPLVLRHGTNWWCYGFDQVKNVTELFEASGVLAATYDYAPFGAVIASSGSAAAVNPITFSSEVYDVPLGLVKYNYRPHNPLDGRFLTRDPIHENGGLNLYWLAQNAPSYRTDSLGLKTYKVPDCTYAVLAGHGFTDETVKKYGGQIPTEVREKSQIPADIRLGKNAAATVVACNDLWYILIRDADGWVLGDGGIAGYDRSMAETKLLHTADKIQKAYDEAVSAARSAIAADKCACKSGIEVKVTCFFTWLQLNFGSTGDVKGKCNLRTTVKE